MPPSTALVVVDMLNPYEHDDADRLAEHVAEIVGPLRELVAAAAEDDDAELVYVNDTYGDFAATREDLAERALAGRHPELVEPLLPPAGCAFLPKIRHSAFYGTPLDHFLREREIGTVILAGQVTEQCVLYSALDAYVRQYAIRVPSDAVAPIEPELGAAALRMMERNMRAAVVAAADCLG